MASVLRLYSAPASEPVTLTEAKAHLRVDTSDDDTIIGALITAARQHVEHVTGRGIVTQTWELVLDAFPDADSIELPRGSLASVTHVKHYDSAGDLQTLVASTDYVVDTGPPMGPGRVILAYGESWPGTRDVWDAVQIRYVVGVAQGSVPEAIKAAIKLIIGGLYEHRLPEVTGTIVAEMPAVQALIAPYRTWGFV
jgi:uncharacterized phiE125 gp8 family phage protein